MSRINSSMVNIVAFSEAGGHAVNEDAFVVERHPGDPECWVCCLGDGQGGRAGGSQASQVACRTAMDAALRESPGRLASPLAWAELLHGADSRRPGSGLHDVSGVLHYQGVLGRCILRRQCRPRRHEWPATADGHGRAIEEPACWFGRGTLLAVRPGAGRAVGSGRDVRWGLEVRRVGSCRGSGVGRARPADRRTPSGGGEASGKRPVLR